VIPRQRLRRKPTKMADKTILVMFSLRFALGLIVFTTITVIAFQSPEREKHFGWIMLLIGLAYCAVVGSILVKALRKYRERYGEKK
jgi:tetrahydromethanopterin S-methyltransferase subunit E